MRKTYIWYNDSLINDGDHKEWVSQNKFIQKGISPWPDEAHCFLPVCDTDDTFAIYMCVEFITINQSQLVI